jgi:hypothetical protein
VAAQEPHVAPTAVQKQHVQEAARTPALAAKANGGHPAIAATARPGAFSGPGVIGARGAAPLAPHPAGTPAPGAPHVNNAPNALHPAVNPAVHPAVNGAKLPPPKAQPVKPAVKPKPTPKAEKHEPDNKSR